MIIFLSISLNMCFRCSKEQSHQDGSFEYPQHMFWLRNKKNNFQLEACLTEGLVDNFGDTNTLFEVVRGLFKYECKWLHNFLHIYATTKWYTFL